MNKEDLDKILASYATKNPSFEKRILNTNYDVLGISAVLLNKLAKNDCVLNYEFSKEEIVSSYEKTYLYLASNLYKKRQSIDEQVSFLYDNFECIDSWAFTDSLVNYLEKASLNTAKEFLSSKEIFLRRFGYVLLLRFCKSKENQTYIFSTFDNDERYYVFMAEAWLLSYCFIYYFDDTYNFVLNSSFSNQIKIKGIQKAIESRRVSTNNKEKLKNLRKKLRSAGF